MVEILVSDLSQISAPPLATILIFISEFTTPSFYFQICKIGTYLVQLL